MSKKLVSKTLFKASAYECFNEFSKFTATLKYFRIAEKNLERFISGEITFSMVEYNDPEAVLQEKFKTSVNICMKHLFKLNSSFRIATGEVFLAKLESFEDYVQVLHEIMEMAQ